MCAAISPDGDGFQEVLGRGKRSKNTHCMDELIRAEGEHSDEDDLNCPRRTKRDDYLDNYAKMPTHPPAIQPVVTDLDHHRK